MIHSDFVPDAAVVSIKANPYEHTDLWGRIISYDREGFYHVSVPDSGNPFLRKVVIVHGDDLQLYRWRDGQTTPTDAELVWRINRPFIMEIYALKQTLRPVMYFLCCPYVEAVIYKLPGYSLYAAQEYALRETLTRLSLQIDQLKRPPLTQRNRERIWLHESQQRKLRVIARDLAQLEKDPKINDIVVTYDDHPKRYADPLGWSLRHENAGYNRRPWSDRWRMVDILNHAAQKYGFAW